MKAEETVCFNIKTAWHGIYRMYNNVASKHGSSTSVGFVLLNIDAEKDTVINPEWLKYSNVCSSLE
jgi:hypothetical protein